jgi:hypothetical protein
MMKGFISPSCSLLLILNTSLPLRLPPFFHMNSCKRQNSLFCWFQPLHPAQKAFYGINFQLQLHAALAFKHQLRWLWGCVIEGKMKTRLKVHGVNLFSRANNINTQHSKCKLLLIIKSVFTQRHCFLLLLKAKSTSSKLWVKLGFTITPGAFLSYETFL